MGKRREERCRGDHQYRGSGVGPHQSQQYQGMRSRIRLQTGQSDHWKRQPGLPFLVSFQRTPLCQTWQWCPGSSPSLPWSSLQGRGEAEGEKRGERRGEGLSHGPSLLPPFPFLHPTVSLSTSLPPSLYTPIPVSVMCSMRPSLSDLILMDSSSVAARALLSSRERKRILSRASEALEMSSLRKICTQTHKRLFSSRN